MMWRPIETAPRDEAIQIAGGDILYPIVASWSGMDDEPWQIDAQAATHGEIEGWPTHWRPLSSEPGTTDPTTTLLARMAEALKAYLDAYHPIIPIMSIGMRPTPELKAIRKILAEYAAMTGEMPDE